MLFFPHGSLPSGLNNFVISERNTSESQNSPDFSSIVDKLELGLAKDVGTITDFQDESQLTIIPMQKLMPRELLVLIIWLFLQQIRTILPEFLKWMSPKTTTIIDCTEVFIDMLRTLDTQPCLCTDCKYHWTIKFLEFL